MTEVGSRISTRGPVKKIKAHLEIALVNEPDGSRLVSPVDEAIVLVDGAWPIGGGTHE